MATVAMNMAVREFVLCCGPDRYDFNVEIQRFAGQRVVAVDRNVIAIDIDYRDDTRT